MIDREAMRKRRRTVKTVQRDVVQLYQAETEKEIRS